MLRYARTGLSVGPNTAYSWRRPFPMTTNRLSPFQIGPADPQSVVPPTPNPPPLAEGPVTSPDTSLRVSDQWEWRKPRATSSSSSNRNFLVLVPSFPNSFPFRSFYLLLCLAR
ncbi:uncharacterized protein CEXT_410851 [Caerostris extrusa]|uniref:Uncharacterized protein n=1 Tax=Caerostris extrusa TaxID=172846 RepID=A0AAV4V907_CAEEX|nr:uncharacterized protein CEXT_410851 [Caerostris extrusa]